MTTAHRPRPGMQRPSITGAPWLEAAATRTVFAALNGGGHEARAVGGAVRNTLMGLPVSDIDLAVTAPPETVMARAERAGLKAVPTGLAHGTVTIVAAGQPFEVTTLREDVETFGRHAAVRFTADWAADARRRDFTMNALYAAADGTVHDPLGGYGDLLARRVRFIGSARARIREDYLRILRFFRFNADYGAGPFDAEGLSACMRERAGLARLSAERVRAELFRLLASPGALRGLEAMVDTGLLTMVLGGVPTLGPCARLITIEGQLRLAPDPVRRLHALAVLVAEDAERLRRRFKLSRAEGTRLAALAARRPVITRDLDEPGAKAVLYRLGAAAYRDRALDAWARTGSAAADPAWRHLVLLPERWRVPRFPLKGADLLRLGAAKGPAVGALLGALEERWIAEGFRPDRAALLEAARRRLGGG